ncbi:MAG: hypothetical protein UHD05_05105, partial [Ruminococcus sp.]|nr:hypothetical protein [Ruminococcus sp.]
CEIVVSCSVVSSSIVIGSVTDIRVVGWVGGVFSEQPQRKITTDNNIAENNGFIANHAFINFLTLCYHRCNLIVKQKKRKQCRKNTVLLLC